MEPRYLQQAVDLFIEGVAKTDTARADALAEFADSASFAKLVFQVEGIEKPSPDDLVCAVRFIREVTMENRKRLRLDARNDRG